MERYGSKRVIGFFFLWTLIAAFAANGAEKKGVCVYDAIPGIKASTRFTSQVFDGKKWHKLFTMETVGPEQTKRGVFSRGIYKPVTGLSSSWSTFETDVPVKVKVTKLSDGKIDSCIIRPLSLGLEPVISGDKKSVVFEIPLRYAEKITTKSKQVPINVAIEINGQSDEMMTVFASPHLEGKPKPDAPGVLKVMPGTIPPETGDYKVLYFMPGVHDLGTKGFLFKPDTEYYIPGDAWVDGGFGHRAGRKIERNNNVKIFGLGVISGRKIGWYDVRRHKATKLLHLFGEDCVAEGITFINSPNHTWMGGSDNKDKPVIFRNIKCHSWRVNTDGLHIFGSGIGEDIFFHAQDDGHYIASCAAMVRFRRWVYWRDNTFGVDIIFSANGPQFTPADSITEDCDSIYNKSIFGGVIIDQRGFKPGKWIDGVVIKDMRIENPGVNKPVIKMYLPGYKCSFKNVLLKNITSRIDNGHPFEITGGGPDSVIENVTFEDIKLGDRYIEDFSAKNFVLAFVKNLKIIRDGKVVATYSSDIEADARQIKPDKNNLLLNPGFEINGYAWKWNGLQSDIAKSGKYSYMTTARKVSQRVTREVVKLNAGTFLVSAYLRIDSGNAKGRIGIVIGQVNSKTGKKNVDTIYTEFEKLKPGKWVKVSGKVNIPWDKAEYDWFRWAKFEVEVRGKYKKVYIDNCKMEKVK